MIFPKNFVDFLQVYDSNPQRYGFFYTGFIHEYLTLKKRTDYRAYFELLLCISAALVLTSVTESRGNIM